MKYLTRQSAGFTLVELLVVMSIIALLLASLLPALSHARIAAKRLQCMSQMRQLNVVWLMYSYDEKSWICGPNNRYDGESYARYGSGTNTPAGGPEGIGYDWYPYMMRHQLDMSRLDRGYHADFDAYDTKKTMLVCPEMPVQPLGHFTQRTLPYGMMEYGIGGRNRGGHPAPKKIDHIKNPSELAAWLETSHLNPAEPRWGNSALVNTDPRYLGFRHDQQANINFVDGHCEVTDYQRLAVDGGLTPPDWGFEDKTPFGWGP